jgi:hypothetical protein
MTGGSEENWGHPSNPFRRERGDRERGAAIQGGVGGHSGGSRSAARQRMGHEPLWARRIPRRVRAAAVIGPRGLPALA